MTRIKIRIEGNLAALHWFLKLLRAAFVHIHVEAVSESKPYPNRTDNNSRIYLDVDVPDEPTQRDN